MILILRGHIRGTFDTKDLYNFVKALYTIFPNLTIYIHTWNIFSNNISWRDIKTDDNIVEPSAVFNYFNDIKHIIKTIIIDDDSKIKLIGNLVGNVGKSKMPLKGWKNYWYGKYSIINYIYNTRTDKNEFVINTRFDLFSNSCSCNYDCSQIINFLKKNYINVFTENKFLRNEYFSGIDNIYIGNIDTMYTLISKFYKELDNILICNNSHIDTGQEYFVFLINTSLFN
jgi:hypothetical protein